MTQHIQITQSELREISELERELTWKTKHVGDMKANLMVLLREGVPVEKGRFDARLVTRIGRAVPWKQVFIERLGEAAANLIKRTFKTHIYFEVQVLEHAVLPLWQGRDDSDEAET
jgi:hypothetical protein